MKLTELFAKKQFVVTSEITPVKGACRRGQELPAFLLEAELVRDYVHALNVADNQSAKMRLGSLAASVMLKRRGIEPIYQLTCRDRNRIALQSDLLSAYSLGIDNVLCLTGDHTSLGDHPTAKNVFDIDSVQLLSLAQGLNCGRNLEGHQLTQPTELDLGAVVNPNFQPLDLQLLKMEKKIAAGARFFQTQPVFDPAVMETFVRRTEGFGVPIQYGMLFIKSPKMARYVNEFISGINVPLSVIDAMAAVPPELYKSKSRGLAARLLQEIAPMVQGVHFMPLGWSDLIPQLMGKLKSCGG
jgi:methylenetetrahydrofolate reductase (NADPH)